MVYDPWPLLRLWFRVFVQHLHRITVTPLKAQARPVKLHNDGRGQEEAGNAGRAAAAAEIRLRRPRGELQRIQTDSSDASGDAAGGEWKDKAHWLEGTCDAAEHAALRQSSLFAFRRASPPAPPWLCNGTCEAGVFPATSPFSHSVSIL